MTGARLLAVAAFAGVLAVAVVVGRLPEGAVRYVDVPKVILPVPAVAVVPTPPARLTSAEPAALAELPHRDPCERACVAVVVTGLGLAADPTARAVALPPAVALSFSPYAGDLALWTARAQAEGHEVLLDLPLQPTRYPDDDAGPLTLLVGEPAWERDETLSTLLAGRAGWLGAVASAGAFAAEPGRFAPIAAALGLGGLAFVELGTAKLGGVARQAGIAYTRAAQPAGVGAAAADKALAAAAETARRTGRAVASLPPTPVALDRLAAWIAGLEATEPVLVSARAVLGATKQQAVSRR